MTEGPDSNLGECGGCGEFLELAEVEGEFFLSMISVVGAGFGQVLEYDFEFFFMIGEGIFSVEAVFSDVTGTVVVVVVSVTISVVVAVSIIVVVSTTSMIVSLAMLQTIALTFRLNLRYGAILHTIPSVLFVLPIKKNTFVLSSANFRFFSNRFDLSIT